MEEANAILEVFKAFRTGKRACLNIDDKLPQKAGSIGLPGNPMEQAKAILEVFKASNQGNAGYLIDDKKVQWSRLMRYWRFSRLISNHTRVWLMISWHRRMEQAKAIKEVFKACELNRQWRFIDDR